MSRVRPFKIARLSDLHLTGSDRDERSEPRLFGRLKGMNAAFRRLVASEPIQECGLVLVTGDVTDDGDYACWEVFRDAIETAGLSDKVMVVPGNHDVCCLGIRSSMRRRSHWDEDLSKARKGLMACGQPIHFPWVAQPDPRVVIFGLNSNNMGNPTALSNAMGRLGYYQLVNLASRLHKHRTVPVKIVALHHSPNIPGPEVAGRRRQRRLTPLERYGHQIPEDQRHGLLLLCAAHRIRLVLHGHLHLAEDRRVAGVRIVGAPAATEPVVVAGHAGSYRFFVYSVYGEGGRIGRRVHAIAVWNGSGVRHHRLCQGAAHVFALDAWHTPGHVNHHPHFSYQTWPGRGTGLRPVSDAIILPSRAGNGRAVSPPWF